MTQADFVAAVERDLQLRHVPLDPAELCAFLQACWPLVEPDDTPETWATAFLQATAHRTGILE